MHVYDHDRLKPLMIPPSKKKIHTNDSIKLMTQEQIKLRKYIDSFARKFTNDFIIDIHCYVMDYEEDWDWSKRQNNHKLRRTHIIIFIIRNQNMQLVMSFNKSMENILGIKQKEIPYDNKILRHFVIDQIIFEPNVIKNNERIAFFERMHTYLDYIHKRNVAEAQHKEHSVQQKVKKQLNIDKLPSDIEDEINKYLPSNANPNYNMHNIEVVKNAQKTSRKKNSIAKSV